MKLSTALGSKVTAVVISKTREVHLVGRCARHRSEDTHCVRRIRGTKAIVWNQQRTPTESVIQKVKVKARYYEDLIAVTSGVYRTLQESHSLQPVNLKHADGATLASFEGQTMQWTVEAWQSEKARWAVRVVFGADSGPISIGGGMLCVTICEKYRFPHFKLELLEQVNGQLQMFINFAARVDLLMDESYYDKYYCTPLVDGKSLESFISDTMDDTGSGVQPYFSKSPWIRMSHAATGVYVTYPLTDAGFAKAKEVVTTAAQLYVAACALPESVASDATEHEQLKIRDDMYMKMMEEKDPGNKVAARALGKEVFAKIQQIMMGDPAAIQA